MRGYFIIIGTGRIDHNTIWNNQPLEHLAPCRHCIHRLHIPKSMRVSSTYTFIVSCFPPLCEVSNHFLIPPKMPSLKYTPAGRVGHKVYLLVTGNGNQSTQIDDLQHWSCSWCSLRSLFQCHPEHVHYYGCRRESWRFGHTNVSRWYLHKTVFQREELTTESFHGIGDHRF